MAKPMKAWRQGKLDIAAWQNDSGQISFTFRKCYKDKTTGEYKETKYLWPSDISDLVKLFQEVEAWQKAGNTAPAYKHPAEDMPGANAVSLDDDIPF